MASSYLNSFGFSELLALSRMLSALRDGPQQVVAPPGYVLTSWRDYKANAKPGDVLFLSSSRNFSNWSAPVRPDEVDESFTCLYAKRAEGVDLCAPNSDYATCTANVASYPKDKVKPFDPPVPSGYMSCPVSEISESSNREDYLLLNPFTFRWEAPVFGLLAYVRQGHTKRFAKRCSALQSPASPMVTAPPIPVGYVASTPLEYNLLAQSGDPTFKWWLPGSDGWQLPANPNRGGSRSAKHGFQCIRRAVGTADGGGNPPPPWTVPVGYETCTYEDYKANAKTGCHSYLRYRLNDKEWAAPLHPEYASPAISYCKRKGPTSELAIPEGYEPCTVEEYRREARGGLRTYLYTRTGRNEWLAPRAPEQFGVPRPGLRTIRLVGNTFLPGATVPSGYVPCSLGEYRAKATARNTTYLKTSPELGNWYVPSAPEAHRKTELSFFEYLGIRACKRVVGAEAPKAVPPSDYPPIPEGFISCTAEFFKANGADHNDSWRITYSGARNWYPSLLSRGHIDPNAARSKGVRFCYRPALVTPPPSDAKHTPSVTTPKAVSGVFGADGFAVVPVGYVLATRSDFIDSSCKPNPPTHLDQSKWQMARVGEPWHPYKKADSTDGSFGFGELRIIRPVSPSATLPKPPATLPAPPIRPWTKAPKVGTLLRHKQVLTDIVWVVTGANLPLRLTSSGDGSSLSRSAEQLFESFLLEDGSPCGDVDPWWNPDNLTAEQLAVGEGFRFVTQSEVDSAKDRRIPNTEWWNGARSWYVGYGPEKSASAISGRGRRFSLRTKAPLPGGAK